MAFAHRLIRPRFALFALLLLSLVPLAGCTLAGNVTVTGKITLNGSPVTGGTIVFSPNTSLGTNVSSTINPDGSYSAPNVLSGGNTVWLYNPQSPQGGVIPSRYGTVGLQYTAPDSSTLTTATWDIALTP